MTKIDTKSIGIINESPFDGAEKLINEGNSIGDPLNGSGGNPRDYWQPSFNDDDYPVSVHFNLNDTYELSHISIFDAQSKGMFEVQVGQPGEWRTVIKSETEKFNQWRTFPIQAETQYVRVVLHESDAIIGEIVLYGEPYKPVVEVQSVRLKITDGQNTVLDTFIEDSTSLQFDFIVDEDTPVDTPNTPPQISAIQNRRDKAGDDISFKVSAIDFDGDSLTYSAVGLPNGIRVDINTGVISGIIDAAQGIYPATVRVSDGEDIAVRSFVWIVEPKATTPPVIPPTTGESSRTLDQFIGTNVLADDPANLVAPVAGNVRIYQYLKWLQDDVSNTDTNKPLSQVKINFNPNDAFGFNHDSSTKSFSELGETYITLFESAMYLTGNDKTWLNAVAYKRSDGRNGLDQPDRWKYVSHLYFQVAARYGSTQVDPSKLITDSQKLSGLGYCKYIEGGNEKDRWWIGRDKADLTPEEHAAYYSAVYDGHMNTMSEPGVYFGVKNADPQIKLMLGGLAFVDFDELLNTGKVDWFERFFRWFEQNRTGPNYETYPIDVICYHDYPNTERKQRNLSGKGLDPETYKWYEKTKAFVEYIGKRCPKFLEVDNNEFGYDRNQSSPQRAEPYAGYDSEDVAAFWTIRCMLEGWAAGLTRGVQFYFRENGGGGGIFQSSGLTDKNAGYKPFAMYHYMATARAAMRGHDFVSRQVIGDMIKYETKHRSTGKKGYILWHFSKSGKQSTYSLDVSSGSVVETKLKKGMNEGEKAFKNANGGRVTINVTEKPTFITEQ